MKYVIKIIHGKKYFICKNTNQIIHSKRPFKTPEIRKFNKIETVMRFIRHMRFWKDKQIIITRNDGREFKLDDAKIVCKLLDKQ